jgi:hypothetical protein
MGAMDSAARTVPTPSISKRRDYKRVLTMSAIAVLVLSATAAILLAIKWPFAMAKMQKELATETSGSVQIHGFRTRYFPPRCVVEGVEFRQSGNSGGPPLLTAYGRRNRHLS